MGHFRNGGSGDEALDLLAGMPVLNMLNTKYVVYHPGQEPVENIHNYGDAWFVDNVKVVTSAEEEISGLKNVDLQKTAVIRQDRLDNSWNSYQNDREGGNIELISYAPDKLTYKVTSPGKKVAVFSEIYYPAGWNAYIDGEKTEIKRVNYILRALMIPDGEHTVEFRFEPSSVHVANTLAIFGGLLILLFAAFLLWKYKPGWFRKS